MTQRYAHLADDGLRKAASIMGDILEKAVNDTALQGTEKPQTAKPVVCRQARVTRFADAKSR